MTSGDISKLVQPGTSEASLEAEEHILQKTQLDSGASVIDKAIVDAVQIAASEGKVDDAIKKWSSIANIAEGIDNDIAAGEHFSLVDSHHTEFEVNTMRRFQTIMRRYPLKTKIMLRHIFFVDSPTLIWLDVMRRFQTLMRRYV